MQIAGYYKNGWLHAEKAENSLAAQSEKLWPSEKGTNDASQSEDKARNSRRAANEAASWCVGMAAAIDIFTHTVQP